MNDPNCVAKPPGLQTGCKQPDYLAPGTKIKLPAHMVDPKSCQRSPTEENITTSCHIPQSGRYDNRYGPDQCRYFDYPAPHYLSMPGNQSLRGGKRTYSPCVLDRDGWENFFLTLPVDYDIKNDPVFNSHRSTYKRLMNIDHPSVEPTTKEMLRTGQCGPDKDKPKLPAFLNGKSVDLRPEPAYRLHLADRTAIHFMRAEHLESVIPWGRYGDMWDSNSVTKRDYKWRNCCVPKPQLVPSMDRKVHHYAKTDLHGRENMNAVVKFDDDHVDRYMNQKLIKLKKAYLWPINPITREALGGRLEYPCNDPCTPLREEIWPCGEMNSLDCNPIHIPHDRCQVLAHRPKEIGRSRERHFQQKSYLDMRYPIRNFEAWEEVPDCYPKPSHFPSECCFETAYADLPCPPQQGANCPPRPPCAEILYAKS